jgi:hypothetical protein
LGVVVVGLTEPTSIETQKTLIKAITVTAQVKESIVNGFSSGRIPSIIQERCDVLEEIIDLDSAVVGALTDV